MTTKLGRTGLFKRTGGGGQLIDSLSVLEKANIKKIKAGGRGRNNEDLRQSVCMRIGSKRDLDRRAASGKTDNSNYHSIPISFFLLFVCRWPGSFGLVIFLFFKKKMCGLPPPLRVALALARRGRVIPNSRSLLLV